MDKVLEATTWVWRFVQSLDPCDIAEPEGPRLGRA